MPAGAFFPSNIALVLEVFYVFVILQVWSDYPRVRRGFFVLKNTTCLRTCVRFVSFENILVSCLKAGRRRFPNVQTPAPSRTGIK